MLAALGRFGPPVVIGQIAAGVVIGASGFKWLDPAEPFTKGLAQVGFALLMFVVGTHLPVRDRGLRESLAPGIAAAATVGALAAGAAVGIAHLLDFDKPGVLGVLLATSSGAVAFPVLQAVGAGGRSALVTTVWIAVADVVTMLMVPMVLAAGSSLRAATGGLLVLAAGAGVYAVAQVSRDRGVVRRLRAASHERGWALDLRLSLLALFVVAWIATRFGTSVLIAGFAVGAAVAFIGEPRRVAAQLIGLGEGFFVPLYFVHLGAELSLSALVHSHRALLLAAVLASGTIAIHLVTAALWKLPRGAGLLASVQLGVPSAVVSIGLETRQISPADGAAMMAAVLVTLGACVWGSSLLGSSIPLTDAAAPQLRDPGNQA